MNQVLGNCQAVPVLQAVQSILFTMASLPVRKKPLRPQLSELGFGHLPDSGNFQSISRAQRKGFADLASRTVELMTG